MLSLLPRHSRRSSSARARVPRESRLCIGGRSWHVAPRSCTEGERAPAGAVPAHSAWADHNSAARRVRASSSRAVPSPERQPAQWRSRLCHIKAGWHVAPRCCTERERAPAGAVSFHRAWASNGQRGTTHARSQLVCSAIFPKLASAVALARVPSESRLCVRGRSWHVAPRSCTEGERAPAGAVPAHSAWADHNSAARRVRASSSRAVPSPERQPAQWRSRLCHIKAGWHVAPRCCIERERAPAGAVSFHRAWAVTVSAARRMRAASSGAPPSSQS